MNVETELTVLRLEIQIMKKRLVALEARLVLQPPKKAVVGVVPTVLDQVAAEWGIEAHEILTASHHSSLVEPRAVAAYILRMHTDLSLPQIGMHLKRHHTTILYAIRGTARKIKSDPCLQQRIEGIERNLGMHPEGDGDGTRALSTTA